MFSIPGSPVHTDISFVTARPGQKAQFSGENQQLRGEENCLLVTRKEVQQRRLAGPGTTDDGARLSRAERAADVFQNLFFLCNNNFFCNNNKQAPTYLWRIFFSRTWTEDPARSPHGDRVRHVRKLDVDASGVRGVRLSVHRFPRHRSLDSCRHRWPSCGQPDAVVVVVVVVCGESATMASSVINSERGTDRPVFL